VKWMLMWTACLAASMQAAAAGPILQLSFDRDSAEGVSGRALPLDERASHPAVDLPAPLSDRFAVALWANASRYPAGDAVKFDADSPVTLLTMRDAAKKPVGVLRLNARRLEFAYFDGREWIEVLGSTKLPKNHWFHYALTSDGSTLATYINGSAEVVAPVKLPITWSSIEVGRWGDNRKFRGRIDELCVFASLSPAELSALIARQNRSRVAVAEALPKSPRTHRYAAHPLLRVGDDVVHPFSTALHMRGAAVPWTGPGRVDLLYAAEGRHFGTRTALYRALPRGPGEPPLYDAGETLTDLPGTMHQALRRGDGLFDLIAEGEFTPYNTSTLIYLKNTGKPGTPAFAEPRPVWIDGKNLRGAMKGRPAGWHVGDVDGDGVEDLLVHEVTFAAGANPDGSFWNGQEKVNQGKGRGYDIAGHWLGSRGTSKLMWGKGARDADGSLSFAALRIVHQGYPGYPGFAVQWKAAAGDRATCLMTFAGRTHVVISGDIDALLALPLHAEGGELYAGDAANLLADDARLKHTYYPTRLMPVDLDGDGQLELLIDGNPARLAVLRGDAPGNFVELDPAEMRGGPIGVDTLANPCRFDWNGDGSPDLIVGDSSGFLTFWPGTDDPLVYGEPVYMRDPAGVIQHQAGHTGSIQGPTERRWGYLNPTVGDWDDDGAVELITNNINSQLWLYRRTSDPHTLSEPVPFTMAGKAYKPAWRCRPAIVPREADYHGLDRAVLLHLDWDGDLAAAVPESIGSTVFQRIDKLTYQDGSPVRLCGPDGLWGRTKLAVGDWDGDGDWDVVLGTNSSLHKYFLQPDDDPGEATPCLLENVGTSQRPIFASARPIRLKTGEPIRLGGHNATALPTDLDGDGVLDLIVGAEDGKVYAFRRGELAE